MGRLIWAYLYQRRRVLLGAATAVLIFGCAFMLYHLPLMAVGYPALICAVLGVIAMGMDFRRCLQRHQVLERLKANGDVESLPASDLVEVRDYQQLVSLLQEERALQEEQLATRYQDMIRYYTLWAHQIKTPIASMKLQLQNMDDERSRRLSSEVRHIEQYVEMVLAFLRLGSDNTDYVFREVELDKLVRACVKRFSGDFIQKKLKVDVTPTNLRIVTDEKWLSFVIEQLLSNAIKYTPAGSVRLYMEEPATLCIRDTGIGIAGEDLPRLFQNGFTGLNGRGEQQASGLGLHLCKRICSNLGYVISVRSVVNEGTTILIDLSHKKLEAE